MGQISAIVEIMEQKVGVESVEQHSIWFKKRKTKKPQQKTNQPKTQPEANKSHPPTTNQCCKNLWY